MTNPGEIEEAIRNIIDPGILFGEGADHRIEDVIATAFQNVTDDDWHHVPDDLTDRLDDYLYGDDRR